MKWIPFNQWAVQPAGELRDIYWEAMELVSFRDGVKEIRAQFEGLKSTGRKAEDARIAHDAIIAALYCCADLADDQGNDEEADLLRDKLEEIERRGIPTVLIDLISNMEGRFHPLFPRHTRKERANAQWRNKIRRKENGRHS